MEKPYRQRVEVVGVLPDGRVIAGRYDNDQCLGLPGGGVEDGETLTAAGRREFLEETGWTVVGEAVLLPLQEVRHEWVPPYMTPAQAQRAEHFRGSETWFIGLRVGHQTGEVVERPACGTVWPMSMKVVQRTGSEAQAERPELFLARQLACMVAVEMLKPRAAQQEAAV